MSLRGSEGAERLDPATLAALDEGIRLAEEDSRRWTPEEARVEAKRLAEQWRKNLKPKASA